MDFKSSHAFFFNEKFGYCRRDLANYTHLSIGSDVWLGTGALVLPHVRSIGHGAVIGAGAVVSNDVPPYAVVVGNPARVVRFRFPNDVVEDLLRTRWWEKPIEELELDEFTRPFLASAPTGLKKPGVPIEAGSKASRS